MSYVFRLCYTGNYNTVFVFTCAIPKYRAIQVVISRCMTLARLIQNRDSYNTACVFRRYNIDNYNTVCDLRRCNIDNYNTVCDLRQIIVHRLLNV